ncbi:variable surface protein [Plasmodium gonderi]|uniref:Variable surface protein n=1 Tax=Plasmodium gonderi TaxID=77519 RepID=A0A1Y1J8M1_PLAGO|nr:variable surface protein [Plasmodium gonderi]GAW78861.1 variable surface protein [Plasmodium gonderi]
MSGITIMISLIYRVYKVLYYKHSYLKNSILDKLYNTLNNEYTNGDDFYCDIDILYKDIDASAINILNKLIGNIKTLLNTGGNYFIDKDNAYNVNKGCIYLKYWFYDQILKEDINERDIKSIINLWEELKYVIFNDRNIPCEFYNMKLNQIKEMKHLYDYFVFYDPYKNFSIINNKIYNSSYCNYLKKCIVMYNKMVRDCSNTADSEVCKEFKKYLKKAINVNYLLPFNGRCKNEKIQRQANNFIENLITTYPFLKKLLEGENISNNTPIIKFYSMLNNEYDYYENTFICDFLLKKYPHIKVYIYKYCNKLKSILDNWDNILNIYAKTEKKNKYCEHLNYWIHDNIKGSSYRSQIIKLLHVAWNWINYQNKNPNNKCWPKNFNISEKSFKKKKQLYLFVEFYDHIKRGIESIENFNITKYCDYIKNHIYLYYAMLYEQDMCSKSYMYVEELSDFKLKLNNDLDFLKGKCPLINFDLIFNKEHKRKASTSFQEGGMLTQGSNTLDNKDTDNNALNSEQFPSYMKYKKLNDSNDIERYCNECVDIFNFEMDYPGISELCYKFVRNLRELSNNGKSEFFEGCSYITHWIYDEIWKTFGAKWNSLSDIPFFHKFSDIGNIINRELKKYCNYNHDSNISFTELKERKELHDYFVNHKTLLDIVNSSIPETKDKWCKEIIRISKNYKNHINECCEYLGKKNSYLNNCSNYFKCDKDYSPYKLLLKLCCNENESSISRENRFDEQRDEDIHKSKTDRSNNSYEELKNVEFFHLPAIESTKHILIFDLFNIFVLSTLSLLGIFLIFFVFYKFTPLGSFLHRRELKKNKNYNLEQQRRNNLSKNNYNSANRSRKNKSVNVAYHS